MNTKVIEVDGEQMKVPDINIGNEIEITIDPREDTDLFNWLAENKGKKLVVTEADYDTFAVFIKGCPYHIDMQFVTDVF